MEAKLLSSFIKLASCSTHMHYVKPASQTTVRAFEKYSENLNNFRILLFDSRTESYTLSFKLMFLVLKYLHMKYEV